MVVALIEELLTKIQQLQIIMIAVSTGELKIHEKEKEYREVYTNISELIEFLEEEGVNIDNPNNFKSLSNWRDCWSTLKSGYASKAGYVHDLYASVFNQINIIFCQHYIKNKSQQELVDEWQISRFKNLIANIKQLKLTMLSVATQGQPIELVKSEDDSYKKFYREVALQISILQHIGIAAPNPNQFQSLWQWYNYWSVELDNLKAAREEYIHNLYESCLGTIEKSFNKHNRQKTSLEEFIQDLKRRFHQQISRQPITPAILTTESLNTSPESAHALEDYLEKQAPEKTNNFLSITSNQSLDNSLVKNSNSSYLNWTDDKIMNPDIFLEQKDITPLIMALNNFALKVSVASDRLNILESAGIDFAFLSNLKFDTQPNIFAQALVSGFKNYQIAQTSFNYHPLVNLLEFLCDLTSIYGFKDQDLEFFNGLVEKGKKNFKALAARNTVVRIESPIGNPIGTGVFITKDFLLTCNHILTKSQVQKAWVRFGYKAGSYESEKDVLELDVITKNSRFDYALLKIKAQMQQKTISINESTILDSGQDIRIIHHPQGNHVIISDFGQIIKVGEDYIDHNLKTDYGSSGAPIFNHQWELIAIHQGNVGIGRDFEPGTTGGIPMRAILNQISPFLG
jgi:S1-C subfamily serine protease